VTNLCTRPPVAPTSSPQAGLPSEHYESITPRDSVLVPGTRPMNRAIHESAARRGWGSSASRPGQSPLASSADPLGCPPAWPSQRNTPLAGRVSGTARLPGDAEPREDHAEDRDGEHRRGAQPGRQRIRRYRGAARGHRLVDALVPWGAVRARAAQHAEVIVTGMVLHHEHIPAWYRVRSGRPRRDARMWRISSGAC